MDWNAINFFQPVVVLLGALNLAILTAVLVYLALVTLIKMQTDRMFDRETKEFKERIAYMLDQETKEFKQEQDRMREDFEKKLFQAEKRGEEVKNDLLSVEAQLLHLGRNTYLGMEEAFKIVGMEEQTVLSLKEFFHSQSVELERPIRRVHLSIPDTAPDKKFHAGNILWFSENGVEEDIEHLTDYIANPELCDDYTRQLVKNAIIAIGRRIK